MTDYTLRLTIVCPESLFPQGNTIAACVGESGEGNLRTFLRSTHEDTQGNRFAVIGFAAKANFLDRLGSPLQAPDFDAGNIPAAQAAVDAATILTQPVEDFEHSGNLVLCTFDPAEMMGLTRIIED